MTLNESFFPDIKRVIHPIKYIIINIIESFFVKYCIGISDDTEGAVFANYLRCHTCYEIVPKSAKIVIFDTRLLVSNQESLSRFTVRPWREARGSLPLLCGTARERECCAVLLTVLFL